MPTHSERRVLPYTPQQLFDLVADIERYPEFLPWCVATRITERSDDRLVSEMVIGFKMFRERFVSRVKLDREGHRIDVSYAEGPFKYLTNHWLFEAHPRGCMIDFFVEFEFRSRLLQKVIQVLFHEAVRRMVGAFEARARDLYGPPPSNAPSTI
jgi:coenzyme Q-binding protein COQ10